MIPVVDQFRDEIRAAGLNPPDVIKADGRLHRFPSNGKPADDAGWYVLHDDGIPAGAFGDWRTGVTETWRADIGQNLTPAEEAAHRERIEDMRREREADEAQRREEARKRAAAIWQPAKPASDDHPYLRKKGISAHRLRLHDGRLVIPMRDTSGTLHSLQTIGPDGDKLFLTCGRVKGCYFSIGKPDGVLCIAEGYATGAAVHQATGYAVAVAFNAGNLEAVAKALRAKFPQARIVIAGDSDANGTGQRKAEEAAQAIGGLVAIPTEAGKDWNDIYREHGADTVRGAIEGPQPVSSTAQTSDFSVRLIRGTDLKPEPISWTWKDWIARGKLHIVAGAPGTGKTTIAMAFAATVTCGGHWPDGTRTEAGNVLIWSGEDDPGDTLLPRLLAMGADRNRIYFVGDVITDGKTRPFDPARDMQALEREAARIGDVHLLIVDPIVNMIAGDSNKNAETRRALQPVVDLAARLDAAALGVSHYSKNTAGRDPVERVTGSVAFGALPRLVFGTAKTTDDEGRTHRLFVRAKSCIGPDGGGFGYDLQQTELPGFPGVIASRVLWSDALDGSARELLAVAETAEGSEERSALTEVTDWLRDLLTEEGGMMDKREIIRLARDNGFSERTIYRARDKLGIRVRTKGFGKDKRSEWSILPILPTKDAGKNGKNEATQTADPEAF